MKIGKFSASCGPLLVAATVAACETQQPGGLLVDGGEYDPPGGVIGGEGDGDDVPDGTEDGAQGPYAGGDGNTFDHMNDLTPGGARDPFEVLEERQEQGPPEIRTRLHSCHKLQNRALENILSALGVDLAADGEPDPAGELYREGLDALGGANYEARAPEARSWTNSGATKLQDIFIRAAPEIIAALPNVEQCQVDGEGVEMFDAQNRCNERAITCLIGRPASEEHVAICNHIIETASDLEKGKAIAVGSLLAGAYTCQ